EPGRDLISASAPPVTLLPTWPHRWGLPLADNEGMDVPACAGCRERDRLVADLRHRVSQLETQVERLTNQLQQVQRAGKRQAAPFAKGPPKPEPKRPGRNAWPADAEVALKSRERQRRWPDQRPVLY